MTYIPANEFGGTAHFGKLLVASVGVAAIWSLALYSLTELSRWILLYR